MRQCVAVVLSSVLLTFAVQAPAQNRRQVDIVTEGQLGQNWRVADGVQLAGPGYPEGIKGSGQNACINLGYFIDKDGKTSDFTVVKSWGGRTQGDNLDAAELDPFVRASIFAVSQWQFTPKADDVGKTFTSSTFVFTDNGAERQTVRGQCSVTDLQALLKEEGNLKFVRNGSINAYDMERQYQNYNRQQRLDIQNRIQGR